MTVSFESERSVGVRALAVGLLLLLLPATAVAATGDRDPDFNGGQPVLLPLTGTASGERDALRDVAVDGRGAISAGGNVTGVPDPYAVLVRRQPDGSPETSFDGDGMLVVTSVDGGAGAFLGGLFRSAAGRLQTGYSGGSGVYGAAYQDNGQLSDTYGFNQAGLSLPIQQGQEFLRAVGTPDGSTYFVMRDTTLNDGTSTGLAVARLDPDGVRDTTYNATSFKIPRDVQGPNEPEAGVNGRGYVDAAVDATGRLVIATTAVVGGKRGFYVMRLTPQGTPDTSFDGDGSVFLRADTPDGDLQFAADAVALGPNGSIAVTGGYGYQASRVGWATVKLTGSGAVDPSFGFVASGQSTNGPYEYEPTAVAVQPDGKVLVVEGGAAPSGDVTILRYRTDGTPDPTFSGDGFVQDLFGFDYYDMRIKTAAVTANNRLVIAGLASTSAEYPKGHGFLARYLLADPTLAPESKRAPAVSGVPTPGQALSCVPGQWTHSPTIQTVWDRAPRQTPSDDDPAWTQVAAGTSYTPTGTDLGSRVRCREIATNDYGSAEAPSPSVRVDAGVPVLIRPATAGGTPVTGQKLVCDTGEWSNGPDLSVRWLRDGQAIDGATGSAYVVRYEDRRTQVGCEVSAANDVGPAAAPSRSNTLLAVHEAPKNLTAARATSATTGGKPTDVRLSCDHGTWDEDYGQYDYKWLREGAEIAGATGATYDATIDDLGRNLACEAFSTNPAGRSDPSVSANVLVPLPASGGYPGKIFTAGDFNQVDPTNLMAVGYYYLHAITNLARERRSKAQAATQANCAAGSDKNAPLPDFDSNVGTRLSARETCGVLLRSSPFDIILADDGTYWNNAPFACWTDPAARFGKGRCPQLDIDVPPVDARTPLASLSPAEQAELDNDQPVRVLWDFDSDGRTDASCDPQAPILRTLLSRGNYHVRAVIISKYSADNGSYDVVDYDLSHFPQSPTQKGAVRPGQPFACKTSLEPPPEPALPCVNEVTFGRVHMTGNLCPISARRIPPAEYDGLPGNVQDMLFNQALNGPLRRSLALMPSTFGDTRVGGLPAQASAAGSVASTQVSALTTLDSAVPAKIPDSWKDKLKDDKTFNLDQAQRAMDQIYMAKGQSVLNGVKLDPAGTAATVLVPSDAGAAIDGVKKLTVSSTNVATSLGGVPIGDPGKLSTDLEDRAGKQLDTVLKGANLDQLGNDLKTKLDLGPFKLGGDAKVKLNNDGTATIDAYAELPKLLTKPGSSPIRVGVQVNASQTGKLSLNGIHMTAPAAYIGAVLIKDLALDYDAGGLSIKGALLFPPVNQGIAINRFRLDGHGDFQELDVDYLAGAGQGINIGPGIFLTKLGGGLSLNPDEVRARAGVSVGPSAGGGCPTAGIDAGMTVHFAPDPFFVDATGTVGLVCIPVGNAHFYADTTGLVSLGAGVDLDIGPLYIKAALNGKLQLPRWQVDLRGDGGIRHLIEATIKALISNVGVAGCGRIEVFPATPLTDEVDLAGGAGVRFAGGRPPLSFPELAANLHIFDGCDLSQWSAYGRDIRAAGDGGRSFTVASRDKVLALRLTGDGGAPKVTFRAPDGKTFDASQLGTDFTRGTDVSGLREEDVDTTIVFLHGQKGTWTVAPADGSPALTDVRHASVLPLPKVTARVGGAGSARRLKYAVAKVPGQVVTFVEQSGKGIRTIKVVKGGGRGTVAFRTSEGGGTKRLVLAEIAQDGLPRDNVTVAHFSAPSPTAGRPPRLRIRRHGAKATATWGKADYAKRYEVVVATGDGHRQLLSPPTRSVSFGGLSKGEGAKVSVTSIAPSGRHGATATKRLRGDLSYSGFHNKKRPHVKRHAHKKKKKKQPRKRS